MPKLLIRFSVLAALAAALIVAPPWANAATTSQLIVVSAANASDPTATLTAYQRDADGTWQTVVGPTQAFLGGLGMGEAETNVHRTPVGTFDLDIAFGRLEDPGTKMPYTQVTASDWWDANADSPNYNTLVHQDQNPGGESENLYNSGPVYDYAVNIAHNPERVPGRAAGMFLHVSNGQPTWGCIAVDKDAMRKVLQWLDPAQQPKITIGVNAAAPSGELTPAEPSATESSTQALAKLLARLLPS